MWSPVKRARGLNLGMGNRFALNKKGNNILLLRNLDLKPSISDIVNYETYSFCINGLFY